MLAPTRFRIFPTLSYVTPGATHPVYVVGENKKGGATLLAPGFHPIQSNHAAAEGSPSRVLSPI